MTVHLFFGYLQGNMKYVCSGMFTSLNGWNFKWWFLFFVSFSNDSFKLWSSNPCFSCSFGPPTPRLISFPVAVLDGGETTWSRFNISFYTRLASMNLPAVQPRFQSTFYSFSVFQWYGHSAHFARGRGNTYADFVRHATATSKNYGKWRYMINEDCIRWSIFRIQSPKLQRTNLCVRNREHIWAATASPCFCRPLEAKFAEVIYVNSDFALVCFCFSWNAKSRIITRRGITLF